MNDSNSNCCCGCQYSTPPWWVTMGFTSPLNNQKPPATGTSVKPGGALGGLGGLGVGGAIGRAVGSVVGGGGRAVAGTPAFGIGSITNPVAVVEGVSNTVFTGLGNILSGLF